ncbi:MAG: hypothetical protein LBI03_00280, partial [Clostridiales bacterium]|nr:hypothetical protein [Clostridiales bacterium]
FFFFFYQATDLKAGLYFDGHIKPNNENAYISTDHLLTGIISKKRVQFMYYEIDPEKKKIYKHNLLLLIDNDQKLTRKVSSNSRT